MEDANKGRHRENGKKELPLGNTRSRWDEEERGEGEGLKKKKLYCLRVDHTGATHVASTWIISHGFPLCDAVPIDRRIRWLDSNWRESLSVRRHALLPGIISTSVSGTRVERVMAPARDGYTLLWNCQLAGMKILLVLRGSSWLVRLAPGCFFFFSFFLFVSRFFDYYQSGNWSKTFRRSQKLIGW